MLLLLLWPTHLHRVLLHSWCGGALAHVALALVVADGGHGHWSQRLRRGSCTNNQQPTANHLCTSAATSTTLATLLVLRVQGDGEGVEALRRSDGDAPAAGVKVSMLCIDGMCHRYVLLFCVRVIAMSHGYAFMRCHPSVRTWHRSAFMWHRSAFMCHCYVFRLWREGWWRTRAAAEVA